jgi:hypothetical protein
VIYTAVYSRFDCDNFVKKSRVKGRRVSFIQNDEVYSIIHDNLNAMTSPGSENAIIDQIIVSVSTTSSPANIRLHTHTQKRLAQKGFAQKGFTQKELAQKGFA